MTSTTISPRPRVRFALLAAMAFVIVGCMDSGENSPKKDVPLATPASFINAFDRYCAPYIGNPAKAVGLLQKDGYVPTAKIENTVILYTRSPDQPMVGLMTDEGSVIGCGIMSRPKKLLETAVASYMGRVNGARPIVVSARRGAFDKSWVTDEPYKTFYVTFTAPDRKLGRLYTFTVGKAQ